VTADTDGGDTTVEGARPALRSDGDRCAELCRQALDTLQHVRGGPLFSRRETGLVAKALLRPGGLDRLLADGRRRVLVGTVDGAVVGMALGRIDAVGEATLGVIDACYVEPPARGVGVGRALIDDLMAWFASSRCRGVDVNALPGDRETKNFLEASGFKARLLTMHRTIE
jgi:GNAT superfamily N-acetyltransferase